VFFLITPPSLLLLLLWYLLPWLLPALFRLFYRRVFESYLPLAETFYLSTIGREILHQCKSLTYEEALVSIVCKHVAVNHEAMFFHLAQVATYMSLTCGYMYLSDDLSTSKNLALYVGAVYVVLGRERIQTVIGVALGVAVPLASNDILLLAVLPLYSLLLRMLIEVRRLQRRPSPS